ncbi:MAG: type II toxin-antitoxin system VapC family toxin [Symploca sp. SIO2C1]|nr:type II toxin-antitoxin system VapC family toxin [Symploca sp. SIO2C1]
MSLLLIDTDIASFIFKGSDYADPYLPLLRDQELALSFMTVQDAWIAATALRHDLPLVTHNIKDFVGISNLQLVTPP